MHNDKLFNEYVCLMEDLKNLHTVGYKSRTIDSFDFNQAPEIVTANYLDFSVNGPGFFKVRDEKNKFEYFTRNGSFKIDNEGNLVNSDGYKVIPEFSINPKKVDKLVYDNNSLVFKDGKTVLEYKFKLYAPNPDSNMTRNGNYFQFEGYSEVTGFKMKNRSLETGNTDPVPSVLRMICILNDLDKSGYGKVKEAKLKIALLEKLLDTITQWQISLNQENVILEIKVLFTKEAMDKSRSEKMLEKVIADYVPFLEPDYE
jgi:hypothetical protein